MSTTVTLQLNATNVAGDWATRSAGTARTGTGALGARTRSVTWRDVPNLTWKVDRILDHSVVLFNVIQNPDGRIAGIRQNGNGFESRSDGRPACTVEAKGRAEDESCRRR